MSENLIHNHSKLSRIISFSNLPHIKSCSPSDMDAPDIPFCMEIKRDGVKRYYRYLVGDFKEWGHEFETPGQRILYERHASAFRNMGYVSGAFLAWHDESVESVIDGYTVIDAAACTVAKKYRYDKGAKKWMWVDCLNERLTLLTVYKLFFGVDKK